MTLVQRMLISGLAVGAFFAAVLGPANLKADKIVVDLRTRDLVFSPLDNMIYASVPNSSALNPNSLTPINTSNGNLGTPVPIGFDPAEVVISDDGTRIHTVMGGRVGAQPYNVVPGTLGTLYTIAGGPEVKQIHAIPGRPGAVLIATHMPGFSPPATGTIVVENSVQLSDRVGTGLGTGGPDIVTVDPTDGTSAYGYQNTITSYSNWRMVIDADGVHAVAGPTLQGVLTGFNVGNIALLGNRLFTSRGEVFNISPAFQTGAFLGGGNFLFDIPNDRLFSMTSSGTTHTLRAYSLTTLAFLGDDMVTDVAGSAGSLTRFGSNGFAFRTSNDQVVLFHSTLLGPAPDPQPVPEPASILFAALGLLGFVALCWHKARRPKASLAGPQA